MHVSSDEMAASAIFALGYFGSVLLPSRFGQSFGNARFSYLFNEREMKPICVLVVYDIVII